MSNQYWDEDEDDDTTTDTDTYTGDGSDLLKKLRKAKRADEKRIKELTDQLDGLSKVQKERTVKEVLEKKGVNAKVARLLIKDLDDITEESVNFWLDENADLFGLTVAETAPQVNELDRAAMRQQDIVTQSALTPERGDELLSRLNGAETAEELIAFINSQHS